MKVGKLVAGFWKFENGGWNNSVKVAEHLKLRYNDHMHKFYYNSAFVHSVFYSHYTTLVVTVYCKIGMEMIA